MPPETGRRQRAAGAAADPGYGALKALVIARTGHHYYADKDELLFDRLLKRFRARGVTDATAYCAVLAGPTGNEEWAALEAEITIGETFFFRYAEQFAALRDTILPGLIDARAKDRRLKIWSAGCSTGAEPYSIAILVHELLGAKLADWSVSIVGTDISTEALSVAREAEYGRWALRTTPTEDRVRWFQRSPARDGATREGGFRLKPEYRGLVRFERQNLMSLISGGVPASYSDVDLILCRNVLIYFNAEAVFGIVRGLGDRLARGGWLLIGHAEPNPAFAGWLTPVNLPGTAAYRRFDEPFEVVPAVGHNPVKYGPEAPPRGVELPNPPVGPHPPEARTAAPAPAASPGVVPAAGTELPRIRALADAGETAEAWRALREALAADPTDARLRFYEGLLALGLGREPEAERALRGAIFVDREFVMAHYHLGLLLRTQGRTAAAKRALDNALRLAQALSPKTVLAEGDGVTAGEMIGNVQLARGDAA